MADQREEVAANSLTAARWIAVSRGTGFIRAAVVAAVLGPTYLGNTFQATNLFPNYTFEFLTGSLFGSLLVPSLVKHVDSGDRPAADRLAGGFLGVVVLGAVVVTLAAIAAGPLLLAALSLGVSDAAVADEQRRVGMLLLLMLMPQVILYGIAGVGQAVMNAHGRFALAYGAPVLENLGVMATMAVFAFAFGTGGSVESVTSEQLLVLGLGSTGAVGLHAAAQWWGAWRVGVHLVPRAGWRDAEVREVMRRMVPSLGYSGLNSLRLFAPTIAANAVAGGVVAFNVALQFIRLPTALGARPVAFALLPRLSRLAHAGTAQRFRDELVGGMGAVLFATVPATVAYLLLAYPLARATAFGEMATNDGIILLAASIAACAGSVLGEGIFVVATNASYALRDARSPLRSMLVRTGISLLGMVVAVAFFDGVALLVVLGLGITIGNIASAHHLFRTLMRGLPPGEAQLRSAFRRALVASLVMAVPAFIIAVPLSDSVGGQASYVAGMVLSMLAGAITFLGVQYAWRSPELAFFASGIARFRAGA